VAHPGQDRPAVLIGAELRAARKLRSLTLGRVAQAAGLSKGFMSRLDCEAREVLWILTPAP
jgi:transcriptional regulator with XRE-family HTH domain